MMYDHENIGEVHMVGSVLLLWEMPSKLVLLECSLST
jgi:hypothetical protein